MKQQTIYFWKTNEPHGYMSQWSSHGFYNEIYFPTAEHWMMYYKAYLFNDYDICDEIAEEGVTAAEAKALGRKVKNFDQKVWAKHRERIVLHGNILKFSQNDEILQKLLNTGHATIAEASPKDSIWGIGIAEDEAKSGAEWKGQNLLGIVLSTVRTSLYKLKNPTNG